MTHWSRLASGPDAKLRHRRCRTLALLLSLALGFLAPPVAAQTVPGTAPGTASGAGAASPATQRLIEAVFNNDLERVKASIADGARYDQEALLGRSALDVAIDLGHFEIAHYLLALRQQSRARLAKAQPVRHIAAPPPFVPAPPPPPPEAGPQPPAPPLQQAEAAPEATSAAPSTAQTTASTATASASPPPPTAASASPPAQPLTPVTVENLPGKAPKPQVAEAPPPTEAPAPKAIAEAPPAPAVPPAPSASPAAPAAPAPETAARPAPSAPATVAALPPAATETTTAPPTVASEGTVSAGLIGVGQSLRLGLSSADPIAAQAKCVDRRSGAIRICLLPVNWPAQVAEPFDVSSFVYSGTMAVARFEKGIAHRYYVQFHASAMDEVTAYYRARLGPPVETRDYQVDLGDKGMAASRLVRWQAHDPQRGRDVVLEVRRYDDVRRQSVDPDFGVVQVYDADSAETFAGLTVLDIMRLR